MDTESKPCPFCGCAGNLPHHQHKETCFFYLLDYASRKELRCSPQLLRKAWNSRSGEDALKAELEQTREDVIELREALRSLYGAYDEARSDGDRYFGAWAGEETIGRLLSDPPEQETDKANDELELKTVEVCAYHSGKKNDKMCAHPATSIIVVGSKCTTRHPACDQHLQEMLARADDAGIPILRIDPPEQEA